MVTADTSEARRLLLDQIAEGVALVDATDHRHPILEANGVYQRLLADPSQLLVGRPWSEAFPEAEAQGVIDIFQRVGRDGQPFEARDFIRTGTTEGRQAPKGKAVTYWDWKCLPLRGATGAVEQLLIIATDATARHHESDQAPGPRVEDAALAAQRRAAQLEAIIGNMVDGVFILDAQGLVLEANEAGLALLGLPPGAPVRRLNDYLLALNPRWGDGRSLEPGTDLLAGVLVGQVVPDEQLLLGESDWGGGERAVSLSGGPVREGDGGIGGAVVLLRDISAQKRADQEKDAFLSLISHEVRSPLTSIKGFAQLARRAAEATTHGTNERLGRHLGVIEQQVERISQLIGDLSEVARLQKGLLRQEPLEFDLVPLARAVVEQQQVAVGGHTLQLVVVDASLLVHADPARIEQVLINLLANAVKYSPNADQVTITLGRDGDSAHLSVRDEGIGIPHAEQRRLFGRFYRASNAARSGLGGLGLGLFIARELVLRSGGRLWVESEEERGSTFHLTLPLLVSG